MLGDGILVHICDRLGVFRKRTFGLIARLGPKTRQVQKTAFVDLYTEIKQLAADRRDLFEEFYPHWWAKSYSHVRSGNQQVLETYGAEGRNRTGTSRE